MYKERMFNTWRIGLLYFAIIVVMPIIPIIIYIHTEGAGNPYLYVLILMVIAPLLYGYINPNPTYEDCGTLLKIESILCSVILIIMLLGDLFLLFLSFTNEEGPPDGIDMSMYSKILISLFAVPVITTIIEIIRCIILDLKSGSYLPSKEKNIATGASNV